LGKNGKRSILGSVGNPKKKEKSLNEGEGGRVGERGEKGKRRWKRMERGISNDSKGSEEWWNGRIGVRNSGVKGGRGKVGRGRREGCWLQDKEKGWWEENVEGWSDACRDVINEAWDERAGSA